jgi:glycosyltransferase involved in cell wall biosynthesis
VVQTKVIKSFFPGTVHKKCSIILNPVNIPERAWECTSGNHKIVSLGRLVGAKNYPMALEAFKLVHDNFPDATYDIYGTGDLRQLLEAESKRLGIEDAVSLKCVTSDVYAVLENAAIFISTSDYEGLSNSMLEAMSIGIPVICTDCDGGGARMMIEDGHNGLIVPKGDIKALYEKIKYLFENETIAVELGRNARVLCMGLTPQLICDEWIKVFDRLEDKKNASQ